MRRLTAVAVIIAVTLVGCSTPAAAQTPPAPVINHVDRECSTVEFPYRAHDVQVWWNCHRDPNIDRVTAGRLAYWLNAVVLNRIAAYLAAVDAARVASCSGPGDCPALIHAVFDARGLDGNAAVRVASCESGLSPTSYNPSSGASGLFQHLARYFPARAAAAGYPGASPFNPYVNTVAAANMVAASGWSAWVCRP